MEAKKQCSEQVGKLLVKEVKRYGIAELQQCTFIAIASVAKLDFWVGDNRHFWLHCGVA